MTMKVIGVGMGCTGTLPRVNEGDFTAKVIDTIVAGVNVTSPGPYQ